MDKITISEKIFLLFQLFDCEATYSIEKLCERLQCSERSVHRLIKLFKDNGFDIQHSSRGYTCSGMHYHLRSRLSTGESEVLNESLRQFGLSEAACTNLLTKLGVASTAETDAYFLQQMADEKQVTIASAIAERQCVLLRNYHTGSDRPIADRLVEPYQLANNRQYCMCFEPESTQCKLFKIDRAESVIPVPEPWKHRHLHRQLPMDVFRMCGADQHAISVTMDVFARNLLLDEYPLAENFLQQIGPSQYRLSCILHRYEGALRFFTSVLEHIWIEEPVELVDLLRTKIDAMTGKLDRMSEALAEKTE